MHKIPYNCFLYFTLNLKFLLVIFIVFCYVCWNWACLVLSVSSSSLCLGSAAACDCGTQRTFLIIFLLKFAICHNSIFLAGNSHFFSGITSRKKQQYISFMV